GQAFLAGFLGVLSFWCWQPGLLFTGAAGLVFCGFLTRPLDRRAYMVAAGAAFALLFGIGYLYANGALLDFYHWCFKFNATSNSSVHSAKTVGWTLSRAIIVVKKSYPGEWLWFALFPVGFLLRLADIGIKWRQLGTRIFLAGSWMLAPEVAFTVYALFSAFNLQSGPDMIFF